VFDLLRILAGPTRLELASSGVTDIRPQPLNTAARWVLLLRRRPKWQAPSDILFYISCLAGSIHTRVASLRSRELTAKRELRHYARHVTAISPKCLRDGGLAAASGRTRFPPHSRGLAFTLPTLAARRRLPSGTALQRSLASCRREIFSALRPNASWTAAMKPTTDEALYLDASQMTVRDSLNCSAYPMTRASSATRHSACPSSCETANSSSWSSGSRHFSRNL
jgi:hypothetical protein